MPYDVESLYLTVGGTLVGGEMWQFGTHWVLPPGNTTHTEALAAIGLDDIRDHVGEWFGYTQNMFPTDSHFAWVKLAHLNTSGKYAEEARVSELAQPVAGGSNGGGQLTWAPVQTSLCISLRTNETLGRANRGRLYLPPIVYGRTAGEAGISIPVQTAVLTSFYAMLWAVAGEMYTIQSQARLGIMSKIGVGKHKLVTHLMLGNIIDTQRRRREQYDETYTNVDWQTTEIPGPGRSAIDPSVRDPYLTQVDES